MPTAVETFEHIIRHESTRELVPFLLALDKKDVVAVRGQTQMLQKELTEHRQIGIVTWGRIGTNAQLEMLFLAAISTYSKKEALAPPFVNNLWMLNRSSNNSEIGSLPPNELVDYTCQLLSYRRPEWLDTWLGNTTDSRSVKGLNFNLLLKLEDHRLIVPSNRLVAISGVNELFNYSTEAKTLLQLRGYLQQGVGLTNSQVAEFTQLTKSFSWLREGEPLPSIEELVFERITHNTTILERAIPLFFEFDTEIDWGFAYTVGKDARKWVAWYIILAQLVAANHLDRSDILTRCLLALRRDFRRPLLTWFKELFLTLQPTDTERLAYQTELAELLPHAQAHVVNFALTQLIELLQEPDFSLAPLLLHADHLLTRPDLKTGIGKLLVGLLKLLKQDATHAPAIARLLATALSHPDGAVQERAAKGLAGILTAPQPLLSPEEMADVRAAIDRHAELLGASACTALAAWLAPVAPAEVPGETAAYAPAAQFVPELSAATAIAPVADWHELLFLTGQVLRHNDPAATERWLDGLLRLNGQWPAGFAGQLRPYLAQLFPEIKKASEAEIAAILREPVDVYGHEGLAQAMLLTWATNFAVARVEEADTKHPHVRPNPLLTIEKQRYLFAESLLKSRQSLPLLSTPTHQPYWVAPSALVARLLAYQTAGIPPEPADLAVALARTAHTHPAETTEALRQLPALADARLRELLEWFLGPADQPLPTLPPAPEQRPPAGPQATVAEALPELWAVAARTKSPAGSFPTLPAALGYDYPGVAQPLRSTFEVVQRENVYPDPERPGQTKSYRFVELAWDSGASGPAPSPLLLYAPPMGKSQYGLWEENSVMADDLTFLLSLIPNHATPLFDQVLRTAAWADKLETSERDLVALALRALLAPGPAFGTAETALLASGLIHHTSLCRSLAQEVLLRAVTQGRLVPATLGQVLGRQLAIGYAPVPRLATNMESLLAIDAVTDDALRQVFNSLLPELPAAPPRNTLKLLEIYENLITRTRQAVPAAVLARLREWQKSASLRKAVSALLV
jgi:hypothetical protein